MKLKVIYCLILLIQSNEIYSQSRWVKQYKEEMSAPGLYFEKAYDCGYLLTGLVLPNYQLTWLIKTDINGDVIWEKSMSGYYSSVMVDRVSQTNSGEIYLCGSVFQANNYDPLLIKLNACGEKEWCRLISTTSDIDFFKDVVAFQSEGCAALVCQTYNPLHIYRTGILRFSPNGELLWQKYHQSPDPEVENESLSDLILTPDSGFLMTGYCYYPGAEDTTLVWLHPYYVKTDSQGNFEWEVILHKETENLGGEALQTILNPSGNCYYSCISHFYHSDTLYAKRPALVKMDLQGNVMGVYDLVHDDYDWGTLNSAAFINDSLLTGGASWFYNEDQPQSRAIIFDTLGNLKNSIVLLNTGWLAQTAVTHDGKLLFYNTIEEDDGFDTYLFKLTQDLDQDTFYTGPFVYDSLCPYQIVSDTIVPDDCDVIVGIEEDDKTVGRYNDKTGGMEIWPNPCRGVLSVKCSGLSGRGNYTLLVYDIYGRPAPIPNPSPPAGGKGGDLMLDISFLPPGIYFISVMQDRNRVAGGKFVVFH